jgi:hypothetical protein
MSIPLDRFSALVYPEAMNDALSSEPVLATVIGGSDPAKPAFAVPTPAEARGVPTPGPQSTLPRRGAEIPLAVSVEDAARFEARLATLEKAIADLKTSPIAEERIAERVLERLPQPSPAPAWSSRLNPFRAPSIPMPSGWLLVDFATEIRFVVAAIFDRRFSMTWPSRGAIIVTLLAAFTSFIWLAPFGLIPVIGGTVQWILVTFVNLVCGGVLFKLLHREAERYRKFLETLP